MLAQKLELLVGEIDKAAGQQELRAVDEVHPGIPDWHAALVDRQVGALNAARRARHALAALALAVLQQVVLVERHRCAREGRHM